MHHTKKCMRPHSETQTKMEWNKNIAQKIANIAEKYAQNIPEGIYLQFMDIAKSIYERGEEEEEEEHVFIDETDTVKILYEIQARRKAIDDAKKVMKNFKRVSRVTKDLKEMAIESYCKHSDIRIPVYSWEYLEYYGHTESLPVGETDMYRVYKEHHNMKMRKYEEMYTIEIKFLENLQKYYDSV